MNIFICKTVVNILGTVTALFTDISRLLLHNSHRPKQPRWQQPRVLRVIKLPDRKRVLAGLYSAPPSIPSPHRTVRTPASGAIWSPMIRLGHRFATSISSKFPSALTAPAISTRRPPIDAINPFCYNPFPIWQIH